MMEKKRSFFWLRSATVIIDLTAVYCLSILIQTVIFCFTFVPFGCLFLINLILYFTLFELCYEGTPGRVLTGFQMIKINGDRPLLKDVIWREFLFKVVLGLLLPVYCFESLIGKQSLLITGSTYMVLFAISIMVLLIFKRQWWEIFSKTTIILRSAALEAKLKRSYIFISLLTIAAISVIVIPALSGGKKKFATHFYPQYPTTGETKSYTKFISTRSQDPVDYIFELFKIFDIVVLSERLHPEYTQYEFFSEIIKDKRFSNDIGNIFTECGSVSFQDTLNTYLRTPFANDDLLNKNTAILQRNSNAIWPLWDNTNLFDLFRSVNRLNRILPDVKKLNWYFTDTPVDWTKMTHEKFLKGYTNLNRDSLMAAKIIQTYHGVILKQQRKKALVIMNSRHGYGSVPDKFGKSFRTEYNKGTTAFLMKQLSGKVANVMINTVSIKYTFVFTPLQKGKWETAFANAGDRAAGFDLKGSPLGDDEFDAAFSSTPGLTYKDVFTGFVFYRPLNEHIKKQGFPYEFTNFEDTILKRAAYVDRSKVETFKALIAKQKSDADPVDSEMVPYAFFSNVVLIILAPMVILLSYLLAFVLFKRQMKNGRIAG